MIQVFGFICVIYVHALLHVSNSMPPTTPTETTTAMPGCLYNGHIYSLGRHQLGEVDSQNRCSGIVCQSNGTVASWVDIYCRVPTPTPPTPPTSPPGCLFEGKYYKVGLVQEALDQNGDPCGTIYCISNGVLKSEQYPCAFVG